jgi:GNAT superfamily N-acetyltransferase
VTLIVRDARPDDGDAIADAHVGGWRVGYRGVVPVLDDPEFDRRRAWRDRLAEGASADGRILVGESGGSVLGFAHVGPELDEAGESTGRGEVFACYVHPDATGVAGALMTACLAELRADFAHAVLWTLRDPPRSRRFYERTGWSLDRGDDGAPVEAAFALPATSPTTDRAVTVVRYRIDLR